MAGYKITLGQTVYAFASLKEVMAKASPLRSGDELSGVAASSARERVAAQMVLADIPLRTFLNEALVPYESDDVTRLIIDGHDAEAFAPVSSLTVGGFRDWLLRPETDGAVLAALAPGLTPEMAAAVSKIMGNQDLMLVASKCSVVTKFRNTIGLKGHVSTRIQPNHPTDDLQGIMASTIDGLLLGAGDAVIGINPATDSVDGACRILSALDRVISHYGIPTQSCVLAHVTTQMEAMRRGAPVDLVFQSIAGTKRANDSFGITLTMLDEAWRMALDLKRGTVGDNVMYFETGQGNCLSADAAFGVDQQTLEARAYAVARLYKPLLVNSVVGFIGPEYLYNGKQITRAGLEDHFCGKMLGLPMGVDVCYTNHADADQNDMDGLLVQLASAGCTYFMSVPGADDIALGYQSTSPHDRAFLQQLLGLKPAPEFGGWLERMKGTAPEMRFLPAMDINALTSVTPGQGRTALQPSFSTAVTQAGFWPFLKQFTPARIGQARAGGSLATKGRLSFQYDHACAQDAVEQPLDGALMAREIADRFGFRTVRLATRTGAVADKETYKRRPDLGRIIMDEHREFLKDIALGRGEPFDLCLIVSDGLSAPAAHAQAVSFLEQLLPKINGEGWSVAPVAVVPNGRVALLDEIGSLVGAKTALILIGERPGLQSPDSLSAYLVYEPRPGKTDADRNCVSNIRVGGLSYADAAETVFYLLKKSRELGFSGVNLKDDRALPGPSRPPALTRA